MYASGLGLGATPDQIDRAFRDYLDEGFEWQSAPEYPEGEQLFRGRQGATEFMAMLRESWSEWRFEPERFLDANDSVVVFVRIQAKGGASGIPLELNTAHVWTIRSGRATSVRFYRDRTEALEAAGLRE